MKKAGIISLIAVSTAPLSVAASAPDLTYFESLVMSVQELVVLLVPLVIALGLLFFIWGLVQFILASGSEEAVEVGKRRMVWGVITLFVIVAVWGLVGLLSQLTGIELGMEVSLPELPF